MIRRIIQPYRKNPGDLKKIEEPYLDQIKFLVHKFNSRRKPTDKRRILILSCFSEFGCETLGVLYCLPLLLRSHPGYYTIVVGWHGRSYLYRHLVDEYWELNEEYQWLRDFARAFYHDSRNLNRLEKTLADYGTVFSCKRLGQLAVGNRCISCNRQFGSHVYAKHCKFCGSTNLKRSILTDPKYHMQYTLVRLPDPSFEKMQIAKTYLKDRAVGIFARGRQCYGRNLQPEFYVKLINLLQEKGYNPIWLGEAASTLPCPVDSITDFTRRPESQDLELTLAIVKQLAFTVQFWTASTRLAGMMGTPYLLFESPDQILGCGQEGHRIKLTTFGPKKIIYAHYINVYENNDQGIDLVNRGIQEMEDGNYDDIIGMIDSELSTRSLRSMSLGRL